MTPKLQSQCDIHHTTEVSSFYFIITINALSRRSRVQVQAQAKFFLLSLFLHLVQKAKSAKKRAFYQKSCPDTSNMWWQYPGNTQVVPPVAGNVKSDLYMSVLKVGKQIRLTVEISYLRWNPFFGACGIFLIMLLQEQPQNKLISHFSLSPDLVGQKNVY